jgi:hypothetical protein
VRSVRGDVLKKVVDFLAYHEKTPVLDFEKPLQSSNMEQILGSWDATFMVRRGALRLLCLCACTRA